MKATTFLSSQRRRIAERLARVSAGSRGHAGRAACLPAVGEVVEEVLSLIAIEEDLFYPALASIPAATLAPARLTGVRADLARMETALHAVMGASDATFDERVLALEAAVTAHATGDDALLAVADANLDAAVLEEIGARMERFYQGSVAAAHDGERRRPPV